MLGAAGRAGQHRNSILSSFGEKMTAAKKNIEELTHSSKLIFFNAVFPTPVAQGMLWTSLILAVPKWCQLISPRCRHESGCSSPSLSSFVSHSQEKQESPVTLSGETWLFPVNVQDNHDMFGPRSTRTWEAFLEHFLGIKPHSVFSPGDIIPLGGGVKPAAPVAEWKEMLFSSARRFSHSSWGAESPRSLLGIIQSRIYMQPRLMSHVRLPFKKSQSGPHPAQIRGKAFNRQSVNSLKNIPSCLYKRLVRNLQTS